MMWRYYELLTDVQMSEIEQMKRETHPMQAKKDLAARIVKDFHSAEASAKAAEDWARQFQKGETPDQVELVSIPLEKVNAAKDIADTVENSYFPIYDPKLENIRLMWFDKILSEAGLTASRTEAARKIRENAVRANDKTITRALVTIPLRVETVVCLGRKTKRISIVD
jgi:tyrosyl-tRNA synthetase